jgi:hypothetical protein
VASEVRSQLRGEPIDRLEKRLDLLEPLTGERTNSRMKAAGILADIMMSRPIGGAG